MGFFWQVGEPCSPAVIVARAAELDLGLDPFVLAEMMESIDRFSDGELSGSHLHSDALRRYFHRWAQALRTGDA